MESMIVEDEGKGEEMVHQEVSLATLVETLGLE